MEPLPPLPPESVRTAPVESPEQMAVRHKFKDYLTPQRGRGRLGKEIAPLLADDGDRGIFLQEFAQALRSAKNSEDFGNVLSLGYDPHQFPILNERLTRKLLQINPNALDSINASMDSRRNQDINNYNSPSQLLPEYDLIREVLAERLKEDPSLFPTVRMYWATFVRPGYRDVPDNEFIAELLRPRQLRPPVPTNVSPQETPSRETPSVTSPAERGMPAQQERNTADSEVLSILRENIDYLLRDRIGKPVMSGDRRIAYMVSFPDNGTPHKEYAFGISEDGVMFVLNRPDGEFNDRMQGNEPWKVNDNMTPEEFRNSLKENLPGNDAYINDSTDSNSPQSIINVLTAWNSIILPEIARTQKKRDQEAIRKRIADSAQIVSEGLRGLFNPPASPPTP